MLGSLTVRIQPRRTRPNASVRFAPMGKSRKAGRQRGATVRQSSYSLRSNFRTSEAVSARLDAPAP